MGWVTGSRNSNFSKSSAVRTLSARAEAPEFKARGIGAESSRGSATTRVVDVIPQWGDNFAQRVPDLDIQKWIVTRGGRIS
jgi:hypothetical protein